VNKTIISAQPTLRVLNEDIFKNKNASFELLGFDVMLDTNLKPWLLEVNQSPSLATDTEVDMNVKEKVLTDVFRILNFGKLPGSTNIDFWKIFPTKKAENYKRFFCFPFPSELFQNQFLEKDDSIALLNYLQKK